MFSIPISLCFFLNGAMISFNSYQDEVMSMGKKYRLLDENKTLWKDFEDKNVDIEIEYKKTQ